MLVCVLHVSQTAVMLSNYCFSISSSLMNKRMTLFPPNFTGSGGSAGAVCHPESRDTSPQLRPDSQARVTLGIFSLPSLLTCPIF